MAGRSHWKTTYVDLSNEPLFPFGFGLSYTTFELSDLRLLDRDMRWVVEPGQVRVMAGTSSVDLPLAAGFEITGDVAEVGQQRVFSGPVRVE